MFRRRRRGRTDAQAEPEAVEEAEPEAAEQAEPAPDDESSTRSGDESPKTPRPNGPHDISEIEPDEAQRGRVDLGGIMLRGVSGLKLQLQVDKRSGSGTSVLLGSGESGVQLMAVAAPRSSGLWGQTRMQMIADARQRGGTAEEADGPFGPEARIVVPVESAEANNAVQPSRVSGIDGPRWMLRATFLGSATRDDEEFTRLVDIVRQTVVVRGDKPMAPGELIPLRPPPQSESTSDDDDQS